MSLQRAEALRRECADMVGFCRDLSDAEWRAPSEAPGWRVQDVLAHVGSACHAIFTPASLKLMTSKDIERTNDWFVDRRRDWEPSRVLAEFERWSGRIVTLTTVLTKTPVAAVPLRLGELGRFPVGSVLGGGLVFDMHTHLRHDLAPALGRPVPATDELRLAVVLDWMLAVLGKQLKADPLPWLDRPLSLSLHGAGGGSWRVGVDGSLTPGAGNDAAASISAAALNFPNWATRRSPWREHDVSVVGDQEFGARFLDAMNVV